MNIEYVPIPSFCPIALFRVFCKRHLWKSFGEIRAKKIALEILRRCQLLEDGYLISIIKLRMMSCLTSQMSFFGLPFIYLFYSACLISSCVPLQKVNIFQSQTTTLNNLQLVSLRAIIKICILRRVDEVLKGLSSGCFTIIKKFMMDLQNPFHWITKCRFYPKCWEGKKYFHLFQDCMIYWTHTSAEYFHYFQWTAVFEAINIFLPIFFWKIPFSLFSDVMVDSFWKMANLFYNPVKSKISRLSIYWQISKSTVKLSRTEKFSKDWAI